MASAYTPLYNPFKRSGTSGAEVSDRNPEQAYNTDLRRVDQDIRNSVEPINTKQNRVQKFFKASRLANKYRQQALIGGAADDIPGDSFGPGGSTSYGRKPTRGSAF
jgi:hypothetical protein